MAIKLRNITSVGVELECGIPGRIYDQLEEYAAHGNAGDLDWLEKFPNTRIGVGTDGTVHVYSSRYSDWMSDAEIGFWSESPNKVLEFVEHMFDCGMKQDYTCGNHVHVRANKILISSLMCREAYEYFVDVYKKRWILSQKHLDRLTRRFCSAGILTFCRDRFVREMMGCRYLPLNFLSLFDWQRTLEIRILPYADNYEEYEVQFTWLLETIDDMMDRFIEKFTVSLGVDVKYLFDRVAPKAEKIEEVIE